MNDSVFSIGLSPTVFGRLVHRLLSTHIQDNERALEWQRENSQTLHRSAGPGARVTWVRKLLSSVHISGSSTSRPPSCSFLSYSLPVASTYSAFHLQRPSSSSAAVPLSSTAIRSCSLGIKIFRDKDYNTNGTSAGCGVITSTFPFPSSQRLRSVIFQQNYSWHNPTW